VPTVRAMVPVFHTKQKQVKWIAIAIAYRFIDIPKIAHRSHNRMLVSRKVFNYRKIINVAIFSAKSE
jgi:hypothetical protein